MIDQENDVLRIILITANLMTIFISTVILLAFRKVGSIQKQMGDLFSFIVFLEINFSIMLLLAQFYTRNPSSEEFTFLLDPKHFTCILLGFIDIVLLFSYFFCINIYMYQLQNIIQEKKIRRSFKKQIIISCLLALLVGGSALINDCIGYNDIGMCSTKMQGNLNVGTLFAMVISLFNSFYSILILIIHRQGNHTMNFQNPQYEKFHKNFRKQFVFINCLYVFAFVFTRILPMIYISVIQLSFFDFHLHRNVYIQINNFILFVISTGGMVLSILRSIEPNMRIYIISLFQCYKDPREDSQSLSLVNVTSTKNYTPNHTLSISGITQDTESSLKTTTKKQSFSLFRQTHNMLQSMNIDISNQQQLQITDPQTFYLILLSLQKLLNQTNQKIQPIDKLDKIKQFDCKHMFQQRFWFNDQLASMEQLIEKADQDQLNPTQLLEANCQLLEFLQIEQILLNLQEDTILLTSYGDPIFTKFRNHLKIPNISLSFQLIQNAFLMKQFPLHEQHFLNFLTYDSQIILSFISSRGKKFITNVFLKELVEFHLKTSNIFLPIYLGLISIQFRSKSYNVLLQKQSNNKSTNALGTWKFQNGSVNISLIDDSELTENQLLSSIKLGMAEKARFFSFFQESLQFLKDNKLWGYSFIIFFFDSQKPFSNISFFSCENKRAYISASFGNLYDGLILDNVYNQEYIVGTMYDPDVYASFLNQKLIEVL